MAFSWRVPLLILVGAIGVVAFPVPALIVGWVGLVAFICLLDVLLAVAPRQLRVTRNLPASIRLTETADSLLTITNPTRARAHLMVRDAWPPSVTTTGDRKRLTVNRGGTVKQVTRLTPTRRGTLPAADVTVRSFGPLGLVARQHSIPVPGALRILPEFRSRKALPYRLARLRELDGQAAVHVRGQGTEFDSLREYAIGDDVRSIDWRASARALKTMVRTWRPERDRQVLLVLDTSRWAAGRIGDQTRLDAGIETCLLLGALGAASGDRISLLAADRTVRAQVASVFGQSAVIAEFANALSQVEPTLVEANWQLILTQVNALCSQRSLVVIITGLDPAIYAEGLGPRLPALAHDHRVIIAHVTDPEETIKAREIASVANAYDAAATSRILLATDALTERVRRLGVEVTRADPEQLAPAVCDTYLALKAAGRL